MRLPTLRAAPLLLLWSSAVMAGPEPCFCLQDAADRLWYDCIKYDKPTSPDPLYDCLPSTRAGERERVPKGHTLTPIEDGDAPCRPCRDPRPPPRQHPETARGQGRARRYGPGGRP